MTDYLKPKSLNAQIKEIERQILNRQREVDVRTAILVEKIQQQIPQQIIVTPANLLLAGSIGFILGELTKCYSSANSEAARTSPLKIALNLITSAQNLYAALPLVWLITSRYQHPNPGKIPEWQVTMPATDKAPVQSSRP